LNSSLDLESKALGGLESKVLALGGLESKALALGGYANYYVILALMNVLREAIIFSRNMV